MCFFRIEKLRYDLEAFFGEFFFDLFDLGEIAGFHADAQIAAGDRHIGVRALVAHANNVRAAAGNDLADADELTGLILECYDESGVSARGHKTARDDTGEDVHVDIATRNEANDLFTLDGELAEHGCCNADSAGALCDELLLFDHRKDCGGNFILGNGNDVIYVFLHHFKGGVAGLLDCDTVCKGLRLSYMLGAFAACTP